MSEPNDTREEVELPALDVTDEERSRIENMRPMAPRNTLLALEQLACRERQLKAALSANREKDAEIKRLKAATQLHNDSAVEAWQLTQKWQKRVFDLEAELHDAKQNYQTLLDDAVDMREQISSLRASVGREKAHVELLKAAIKDHISDGHHFGPRSAALRNALAGVAPPSLPIEKE